MSPYDHLAFVGAMYAQCGAAVSQRNPSTAIVADATCPECRQEHENAERVNASLHRSGMKAAYEV
jgi:hypothetical protein